MFFRIVHHSRILLFDLIDCVIYVDIGIRTIEQIRDSISILANQQRDPLTRHLYLHDTMISSILIRR
jgi:hypothetical protein